MKMKKLFLLFSMITVLFSLTACSNGQGEVDFDYKDTDVVLVSVNNADYYQTIDDKNRAYIENEGEEVEKAALSNFDVTAKECGAFKGYLAKDETGKEDVNNLVSIDFKKVESVDELLAFLGKVYYEVEENGKNVIVTLKAAYEKRTVDFQFVYEKEPRNAYVDQTLPFKLAEFTATPEYTLGEKMKKAGSNTLMGMGTVFIVLIFISLVISQFDKLSKIGTKKEAKGTEKAASKTVAAATSSNLTDDKQLVAVITAAIMAANGNSGSGDKLVVRSIKKAKR